MSRPAKGDRAVESGRPMLRVGGFSRYRVLGKQGEGTFSEVFKCESKEDGETYAIKRMRQHFDDLNQVKALQEIRCLCRLSPHSNIVNLREVIYDPKHGHVALVCELMDMNLYEMIKDRREPLAPFVVKDLTFQLLKGLQHMHSHHLFHRDIKPENILVRSADNVLKLADFGSSRNLNGKPPFTEYISTRWYRAPECLITDGHYGYQMDIWSAGCVFYEIYRLQPLFPGRTELDQVYRIHQVVGTPSKELLQNIIPSRHMDFNFKYSEGCGFAFLMKDAPPVAVDLITKLCQYDPQIRITAAEAVHHAFFKEVKERKPAMDAIAKAMTKASKHKHSRRSRAKCAEQSEIEHVPQSLLPQIHSTRMVATKVARPLQPRAEPAATGGLADITKAYYSFSGKSDGDYSARKSASKELPSAQLKDYHLPSSATHHDHGAPGMVGGYRVGATSAYQSMPSITEHGSTRHSAVALPHIGQAGGRAAKAAVPLKQPKRVKDSDAKAKKKNPYSGGGSHKGSGGGDGNTLPPLFRR